MEPPFLPPGTQVGPWRVASLRGRGAYGMVHQVERPGGAPVGPFALKLAIFPEDPRFTREVELLSRIHHPHVPRLYDHGRWTAPSGASYPYLVMDWVQGVPLYEWARQRGFTSRQALRLLAQLSRALEATHAVGGVHRDVKGDNVLVREDGTAVLMDFGAGDLRGARRLTQDILPPGTPEYRSPEALLFQWRWRRHASARYQAGPADDVYALGVTAYRLVTGKYPPPRLYLEGAEEDTRSEWVPPEELATVCPELAELIRQLLSTEPSSRSNAQEMAERLEHAAKVAGRKADQRITPRAAGATPPRSARASEPRRAQAGWLLTGGVALGAALAVGTWGMARWQSVKAPEETAPGGASEDGGSTGLGDDAHLPPGDLPTRTERAVGLDMPKKPFPGQRRPPCVWPRVEINGGCWLSVNEVTPPCGDQFFEYKSRCYEPILGPPRPETSGSP